MYLALMNVARKDEGFTHYGELDVGPCRQQSNEVPSLTNLNEEPCEMDYCFEAKNLLRAQMASKGITIVDLAHLLNADGCTESPHPLAGKINRGKFPLAFFLQCMKVMGMDGTFVLLPKDSATSPVRAQRIKTAKKKNTNVNPATEFPPTTEPAKPRMGRPRKRPKKELLPA